VVSGRNSGASGVDRPDAAASGAASTTNPIHLPFELLNSSGFSQAFELRREPDAVRERYGDHPLGRNLLLARRLVEAEVPVIQVNDMQPTGGHLWDLHYGDIFHQLKDELLPRLDQALTALLTDLRERGLLEQTLVVVGGEFGRTPWIDKELLGRMHWPNCYSLLLAGGGIQPGRTFGVSDSAAAYPIEDGVGTLDVGATLLHLAGVDPSGMVHDRQDRPHPICSGQIIRQLI